MAVTLNVNGKTHEVDADPGTPLLYVLRNDLAAERRQVRLRARPVRLLHGDGRRRGGVLLRHADHAAGGARDHHRRGARHARRSPGPMQPAFIEEQAAQCGYCIPGMMMRAQALLQKNPRADDGEIRAALEPNLCRCGTHMRIVKAVKRAGELMQSQAPRRGGGPG